MKHRFTMLLLVVLTGCGADTGAANPSGLPRVTGRFLAASGNVEVEIAPCGQEAGGGRLCGTIVRVLSNRSMSGGGQMQGSHDDTGLRILTDFVAAGDSEYHGQILNRESGKTYRCIMKQGTAADELVIRPYVVLPLFGQTQIWHRLP